MSESWRPLTGGVGSSLVATVGREVDICGILRDGTIVCVDVMCVSSTDDVGSIVGSNTSMEVTWSPV